jgi:hypothetical protein
VLGHDVGDGVTLGLLLQGARDPGALRPSQEFGSARLALGQRPVVEIGGVVEVARRLPLACIISTYSIRREIVRRSPEGSRLAS